MTKKSDRKFSDLEINWAIRDIPRKILSYKLKATLYAFASIIGLNDDWYFHSHTDLAEKVGCCVRVLPSFINQLEDAGFLFVQRPTSYKRGNSNEYKINYDLIISTAEKFRK